MRCSKYCHLSRAGGKSTCGNSAISPIEDYVGLALPVDRNLEGQKSPATGKAAGSESSTVGTIVVEPRSLIDLRPGSLSPSPEDELDCMCFTLYLGLTSYKH